jgi:hypothetical protein
VPIDVVCPTCNTVSHVPELERDSNCFCRTCDYPLFWAARTSFAGTADAGAGAPLGTGLRRMPGTEGWAVYEQLKCPVCSEPNLVTEDYCVRCGADLHPRPPVPVPPPPPPPVAVPVALTMAVPVRRRRWWPWLVAAAVVLAGVAAWLVAAYA